MPVTHCNSTPRTAALCRNTTAFFFREQGEAMPQKHAPSLHLHSTHKKLTDQLGVFYRAGINFFSAVKRK